MIARVLMKTPLAGMEKWPRVFFPGGRRWSSNGLAWRSLCLFLRSRHNKTCGQLVHSSIFFWDDSLGLFKCAILQRAPEVGVPVGHCMSFHALLVHCVGRVRLLSHALVSCGSCRVDP